MTTKPSPAAADNSGKAVVIDVDGSVKAIDWPPPGDQLSAMYEAIGCRGIELVRIDGADIWLDEDGKAAGKDINPVASALAWSEGRIADWDCIVGPVLLTGHDGPETTGLDKAVLAELFSADLIDTFHLA